MINNSIEKILEKSDQLVYSLFLKLKLTEAHFILERDSIQEEDKGIKLTIIEPIKELLNKKREFLITKTGNVKVLKDIVEENKKEASNDFINRTTYKVESCKEDLYRMTKEKPSITLEVREDSSFKIIKSIIPSIIYLNSNGQILDIIPQDKRIIENQEDQVKSK